MIPLVIEKFTRMGARATIRPPETIRRWRVDTPSELTIDIARNKRGEFFDIRVNREKIALEVLDIRRDWRHLLLISRDTDTGKKEKFLCGHDERAWFVAAVPGTSAYSVHTAMEALKPTFVRSMQDELGIGYDARRRRKTAAYLRQGEWFFVPVPEQTVPENLILNREPIRRGLGKPHMVQELFRQHGELVYTHRLHPTALTEAERSLLLQQKPAARSWKWKAQRRNPTVFARGQVSHADHAAIYLDGWHRVLMNTESEAPAMRHVTFID